MNAQQESKKDSQWLRAYKEFSHCKINNNCKKSLW